MIANRRSNRQPIRILHLLAGSAVRSGCGRGFLRVVSSEGREFFNYRKVNRNPALEEIFFSFRRYLGVPAPTITR